MVRCIQDLCIYCTQSLSLTMRGGGVSRHLVSYMPDALGLALGGLRSVKLVLCVLIVFLQVAQDIERGV